VTDLYRAVLNTPGAGSIFLGNLPREACDILQNGLAAIGVDTLIGEEGPARAVANPATGLPVLQRGTSDEEIAQKALNEVRDAQRNPLYPTRCSVGRPEHRRELPPITKALLESVTLEEAVANLVFFMPKFASNFSTEVHQKILTERHISQEDIQNFSAQDASALKKAVLKFVTDMLSFNAKLKKSKVPRSLGIEGAPDGLADAREAADDDEEEDAGASFDDDLFVECEVPGAVGLSLLPNSTLVLDNAFTGERGYLQILRQTTVDRPSAAAEFAATPMAKSKRLKKGSDAYNTALEASIDHQVASFDVVKQLTEETLSPFESPRFTCCKQASKSCITVCLYSAGGRFNTLTDMLGQRVDDVPKDARYNRMYTGFWHTAFIANPIYFIRILIEAIVGHILSHKVELCTLNARRQSAGLTAYNSDWLLRQLPPSVRLNLFSDYTWELICPALFQIFDGKTKFGGRVLGFVQFYDYTKIAGRWSRAVRDDVAARFGVADPMPKYTLPSNYHLTFSFSGTAASALQSTFASTYAKQNSTVVFYTFDLTSTLMKRFRADLDSIVDPNLKGFVERAAEFADRLAAVLKEHRRFTVRRTTSAARSLGPYPARHKLASQRGEGLRVINGDAYDLRHLDRHVCKDLGVDAVVVGLRYKDPQNIRINVGGGYIVNPLTATMFGQFKSTATFSALRVGLGLDIETLAEDGDLRRQFSLVLTPTEMGEQAISRALAGFMDPSQITFATESGEAFADSDSVERLVNMLNTIFNDLAIVQSV
jgi:hypothetical protein